MRSIVAPSLVAALAGAALAAPEATETDRWTAWSERRAEYLRRRGVFEDAVEELRVIAALRPHDPEPLVRAAVIAVDNEVQRGKDLTPRGPHYRIAEVCVRQVMPLGGAQEAGLAYTIGRLRLADQQWGTAWRMLKQAREMGFDPVRTNYWYYRAVVNRCAALVESGKPFKALDDLRTLLREQPGHPDEVAAKINLASAHRSPDVQEPGVAKQILEEVLRDHPGNARAVYVMGLILTDEGDTDAAVARFREALGKASVNPDDPIYRQSLLREAEIHLKVGRVDEAEDCIRRYRDLVKEDAEGLFAQGRIEQARGRPREAVRLYRRAVRLEPEAMDTLLALNQVLYQLGEEAEAQEVRARIDAIRNRRQAELEGTDQLMK